MNNDDNNNNNHPPSPPLPSYSYLAYLLVLRLDGRVDLYVHLRVSTGGGGGESVNESVVCMLSVW